MDEPPPGRPEYFATVSRDDLAGALQDKIKAYYRYVAGRGLDSVWDRVIRVYYGRDADGASYKNSLGVTFDGEAGELVQIAVNQLRSIVRSLLSLTTAERPALKCHATNSDAASYDQSALGDSILEYYLDEGLERTLYQVTEYAVVLSEGYLLATWDQSAGRLLKTEELPVPGQDDLLEENERALAEYDLALAEYDLEAALAVARGDAPPEEPPPPDLHEIEHHMVPTYEGDIRFRALKPEDVVRDTAVEDGDYRWVIVGYRVNRWDLAAQYSDHRDAILGAPADPHTEYLFRWRRHDYVDTESDQVYVRELFHLPTPACPKGRTALMVGEVVLKDGTMPYRQLPIVQIVPSREIDSCSGYGSVWDLLAPQEVYDAAMTTALSNHDAFGLNLLWAKPDSHLDDQEYPFGLQVIKSDEKPEFITGQAPSTASLELLDRMRGVMEVLSGVNEAVRGIPQGTHVSGAYMSELHSAALAYTSDIQRGYGQAYERAGNLVIEVLQAFAEEPKLISITGKSQLPRIRSFTGDDLKGIRRVKVDLAAPNLRTAAGKQHAADLLLQNKVITDPKDYLQVVATGSITPILERPLAERTLISEENEELMAGQHALVLAIDDHLQHIREHSILLAHPSIRRDKALVDLVMGHIGEHVAALQTMDPTLAGALGLPLPAPPAPPAGEMPPAEVPPAGAAAPPEAAMPPAVPPPVEPAPAPAGPPVTA